MMLRFRGPKQPPKKQRGMALIVAIMIVALVTVLSVEVFWYFNLVTSRHGNRLHGVQGKAYLDALEDFARNLLQADMEDNQVDNLSEVWAQQQPPFETDYGYVGGRIEDAQGRFNLNQLQSKPNNPDNNTAFVSEWHKRYTVHQRRFIRLLQTIEIEEGTLIDQTTAENITEAIIDWLDPDSQPTGFGGAEGDHYSRLDPPMTITNGEMASVSELSLVKGVTPKIYESLLPLVIVLPTDVPMNVNTMDGRLMRMLNVRGVPQPLSVEEAQILIDSRGVEGFQSVQDFLDFPDVASVFGIGGGTPGRDENNPNGFDADGLAVQSSFFIFYGETMVNDYMQYSKSMLMRTNQDVVAIRRTDANF